MTHPKNTPHISPYRRPGHPCSDGELLRVQKSVLYNRAGDRYLSRLSDPEPSQRTNFDANINVSVFETNIRIVGGLLAAHLVARRAGVQVETNPNLCLQLFTPGQVGPGWPCSGPLLALAEDAAQRLLPAFDTPTGSIFYSC